MSSTGRGPPQGRPLPTVDCMRHAGTRCGDRRTPRSLRGRGTVDVDFEGDMFAMNDLAGSSIAVSSPDAPRLLTMNYDRNASGTPGNSTRRSLAGRRTPSGSGEAVPPSVVT